MSTVVIERGIKSYSCWNYLKDTGVEYTSYRYYPQDLESNSQLWVAFQIADSTVASYCALKFS